MGHRLHIVIVVVCKIKPCITKTLFSILHGHDKLNVATYNKDTVGVRIHTYHDQYTCLFSYVRVRRRWMNSLGSRVKREERPLAVDVARGVVAADDEDPPV